MLIWRLVTYEWAESEPIALVCPRCGAHGSFEPFGSSEDIKAIFSVPKRYYVTFGQRQCPNLACRGHIFVEFESNTGEVLATLPTLRTSFDLANVPNVVNKAINEALDCHANQNYMAAAMMLRKSVELICDDMGATEGQLFSRIEALKEHAVLPNGLISGMHNLRLLGNDAAHITAKAYNSVERPELDAAIGVVRLLVNALYQTDAVLELLERAKFDASNDDDSK